MNVNLHPGPCYGSGMTLPLLESNTGHNVCHIRWFLGSLGVDVPTLVLSQALNEKK